MKKIIAISLVLLGIVFLAGCGQKPTPLPVDDALKSKITSLEQKWEKGGLVNWQKEDFIIADTSIIAPKNLPKSFVISKDPKDIKDMDTTSQLGSPTSGVLLVGESNIGNLWGSCLIVQNNLPQGKSLEQWIQNTWQNIIAKDDCNGKNQPLSEQTENGETWSDFCKDGAHIENKVSDKLIRWDTAYIGSPSIISTVVGNNVISFECGQDISESTSGKLDFVNLVEDIMGTLQ